MNTIPLLNKQQELRDSLAAKAEEIRAADLAQALKLVAEYQAIRKELAATSNACARFACVPRN